MVNVLVDWIFGFIVVRRLEVPREVVAEVGSVKFEEGINVSICVENPFEFDGVVTLFLEEVLLVEFLSSVGEAVSGTIDGAVIPDVKKVAADVNFTRREVGAVSFEMSVVMPPISFVISP